jgi:hypothetical protein
MDRLSAQARGSPGVEQWIADQESLTAAYFGRLQESDRISRHVADLAEQAGQREAAALFLVTAGLRQAFFGNGAPAQRSATAALMLSRGREVEYGAAITLALAGDASRVEALADDLEKRFPEDTQVRFIYLPQIRALVALSRKEPGKAVNLLQTTIPYELGVPSSSIVAFFGTLYPIYVRGQAYLAAHQGAPAAAEFQKILAHRTIVTNDVVGAVARLQLGRSYAMAGDQMKAKAAYEDFLNLWKDADPDIPILQQAKAEYARQF